MSKTEEIDWLGMTDEQVLHWMRAPGPLVTGLQDLCRDHVEPEAIAAEIGCFAGASTRIIAEAMRGRGVLYCVDTWAHGWYGDPNADVASERVFDQFAQGNELVVKMRLSSREAAKVISDGSLDFCYVDATKEDIDEDLVLWTPKVRLGGTLAGHDCSRHFPGVRACLSRRFGDTVSIYEDTSWAVKL